MKEIFSLVLEQFLTTSYLLLAVGLLAQSYQKWCRGNKQEARSLQLISAVHQKRNGSSASTNIF